MRAHGARGLLGGSRSAPWLLQAASRALAPAPARAAACAAGAAWQSAPWRRAVIGIQVNAVTNFLSLGWRGSSTSRALALAPARAAAGAAAAAWPGVSGSIVIEAVLESLRFSESGSAQAGPDPTSPTPPRVIHGPCTIKKYILVRGLSTWIRDGTHVSETVTTVIGVYAVTDSNHIFLQNLCWKRWFTPTNCAFTYGGVCEGAGCLIAEWVNGQSGNHQSRPMAMD